MLPNGKVFFTLAINVLELALNSEVVIQGQFLETFSGFANAALIAMTEVAAGESPSANVERLYSLLERFLLEQNLSINDLDITASTHTSLGVILQRSGEYEMAEGYLRVALRASDLPTAGLKGLLHYNLMLAIAQQPGRLAEAFAYKADHQHLLTEEESVCGSLEQRIEMWDTERQLYDCAKDRLLAGDLDWQSDWCVAHKEELIRAQRRWGWLRNEPVTHYNEGVESV